MATLLLPNLDAAEPAVSTFELRRFLGGELDPERRAAIESLAATDLSLRTRLAALSAEQQAEEAAFRLQVPLPRFLHEHERRTASTRSFIARLSSLRFTVGASLLAASAAAVFFIVTPPDGDDPTGAGLRLKGDARVGFVVREANGAHLGTAGEQLEPGDQIQFAVKDDAARPAMVLVGVDGRGVVTVYAAENVVAERLKGAASASKPRLLPASVVLDDATGPERFFVVYGSGTLDDLQRTVSQAARALAASGASLADTELLPLPADYSQSSVHIQKVTRSQAEQH